MDIENSVYAKKARDLFYEGYNCSQSVFLAFADKYDMDPVSAAKISSSFGGGMGRLREVCGTVSGMFMVLGMLYGYDKPGDYEGKAKLYERIQELARRFEEENGSIICRELLGLSARREEPVPEKRTPEYYKKRPCPQLAAAAAAILEEYLKEQEMEVQ